MTYLTSISKFPEIWSKKPMASDLAAVPLLEWSGPEPAAGRERREFETRVLADAGPLRTIASPLPMLPIDGE